MAKYLKLNADLYGTDGMIPLHRGDDWSLKGTVVQLIGDQEVNADLTAVDAASAYFPSADGTIQVGTISMDDKPYGKVTIGLTKDKTVNAGLAQNGSSVYIILDDGALNTVDTLGQPLKIQDRGFNSL